MKSLTRRQIAAGLAAASLGMAQRKDDINQLPSGLPVPVDDGACDHLAGMRIPDLALESTRGHTVNLSKFEAPRIVIYAYPRTGEADRDPPPGWNEIPGARGCTPQSCSMRDHYRETKAAGAEVFGLSTQTSEYQREMVERLHLPFEVLSDHDLKLTHALKLPTFSFNGMKLIKRLTLVVKNGRIEKVFYPVFPPDKHGEQVLAWLKSKQA